MRTRIDQNKIRKDMYHSHKLVAKNLRLLRNIKGLKQEVVADALHLSRSAYGNLENGSKIPDYDMLCTLAGFYDINMDYLLSFDISEQMLSLFSVDRKEIEPIRFMERYLLLSHNGKEQIRDKLTELTEREKSYNKFPLDYSAIIKQHMR